MYNLIRADLFKLRKSLAVKILFCITCVSALSIAFISYFMAQGRIETEATGIGFLLTDIPMMTLLGTILAATSICGDFENKTIQDAIACGHGRGTLIISKALSYFLAVALILLPYMAVTFIAFCTGNEFTSFPASVFLDIMANESGLALTPSTIFKMIIVMLITMIVYLARLSICILLSFLFKKPIIVVGVGYVLILLCDKAIQLGDSIPILKSILSYTPFAVGYNVVSMDADTGVLLKAIAISIVFMILILAITYSTFRRAEIK